MGKSACTVWKMFQARCLLCAWFGEVHGDPGTAADDAREHRRTDQHRSKLKYPMAL